MTTLSYDITTIDATQLTTVIGGTAKPSGGVCMKIKKAAATVGAAAAVCLGPNEPDMESVPRFPTIEQTGGGTTSSQAR